MTPADLPEVQKAEKEMHNLYLQCKSRFDPKNMRINDSARFESKEEWQFRCVVSDFFLAQKQKEILGEEE